MRQEDGRNGKKRGGNEKKHKMTKRAQNGKKTDEEFLHKLCTNTSLSK